MNSIKQNDKFYRLPKRLFTDEQFRNMTNAAKALYMILLDRRCLSEWNGNAWRDLPKTSGLRNIQAESLWKDIACKRYQRYIIRMMNMKSVST